MKKVLQTLLAGLLTISSIGAQTIYTNHTYLSTRSEHNNAGMRWATMMHNPVIPLSKEESAQVTIIPFYTRSTKATTLGTYFGMNGENNIVVSESEKDSSGNVLAHHKPSVLNSHEIDHAPMEAHPKNFSTKNTMKGILTLAPQRESYGAILTLTQSLERILPGLSLELSAPVTCVKTTMGATADNTRASQVFGKTGGTISDYFAGTITKTISNDTASLTNAYQDNSGNDLPFEYAVSQAALMTGKIDNAWQSALGIADLSFRLSYDLFHSARTNVLVGSSVVFPTGNQSTGTHLLEPIYGNNGHIAAGLFSSLLHEVQRSKNSLVQLVAQLEWNYLLKGNENRIFGVYDNTTQELIQAAPYRLAMKHEQTGVFPLANEITLNADITPGNHIEGVLGFAGHIKKLHFTLGYNFFTKDAETVSIPTPWKNDTIAFADPAYNMSAAAVGVHGNKIGAGAKEAAGVTRNTNLLLETALIENDVCQGPIQQVSTTVSSLPVLQQTQVDATDLSQDTLVPVAGEKQSVRYNLSTAPATNGRQTTHSIVGGLHYKVEGPVPCIIGMGGQYEIAQNNNAISNYKLWLTCGFTF